MTSAKNIKFFGLTIALISTTGKTATKRIVKVPHKLQLPKFSPGNFLVCPLSVEMLVALTLTGAKGNTAKEMANALLLPQKPDRIQQAFQELNRTINRNETYHLGSTTKIFHHTNSKLNEKFKETAISSFNAEIEPINFQNKGQAVLDINKWVSEKTLNHITNLVKIEMMDKNIRMAIINTVTFKGRSMKEFSRGGQKPFFINQSDYVDTTMMESVGFFNFSQNLILKARSLEVPYEGNDIVATLVLPDERMGLDKLESRLDELFMFPQYKREPVHVRLPKFQISTAVNFREVLQGLGVKNAFQDTAEFSRMMETEEPLKITTIIHKSFIDGEEISKNSVISTSTIEPTTNPSSMDVPHQFYIDHPFVFYVKHRLTGIFFIGRMYRIHGIIKNSRPTSSASKNKLTV